jgi:hypothetical protein
VLKQLRLYVFGPTSSVTVSLILIITALIYYLKLILGTCRLREVIKWSEKR